MIVNNLTHIQVQNCELYLVLQPQSLMSVKELRSQTAEHMRNHAGDFLPFLTNPETGDMYTTGNAYR